MESGGVIAQRIQAVLGAHDGALRRALLSALVVALVALALEVFLFNMNFFRTMGYEEIHLEQELGLTQNSDGDWCLYQFKHKMEALGLDQEIHNIHLAFNHDAPAQLLTFKIRFTDEAHRSFFGTTDYTQGIPDAIVSTASEESGYVHLSPSGTVGSLSIDLVDEGVSYPVRLKSVSINAPEPFSFNTSRFLVAFIIIYLGYLFRPRSRIYSIGVVEAPLFSKGAIISALIVEVLLVSSFMFMNTNQVGVATESYNSGSWDGQSIVSVHNVGGPQARQYALLARAFADGQLYLEQEPPAWLAQMDDPYDKGARDEARKVHGEDYLFDTAYYDGKYYVYFGVVPVLLFYLPFYLATGADFPTAIGVLIAMLAFLAGCTALLDRFARYHFKHVSIGVLLLLQIPLTLCSGTLYLVKFPTFYSLPIMCALAFSVWGLYLWMRGRASKTPGRYYVAGSACMALVVGCRPQLLALSLVAFPLFWRLYITKQRLRTPVGMREFACLIAPFLVVAGGLMWYNAARFGSPLDFGANYNLTVHDMPKRGLSLGRLAPALFAYFLQPPHIDGTFPFILAETFNTTFMGETVREATFGGILACLPVLWIIPFARPILKLRFQQRSTNTIAGVTVVLLASGVIVALFDAELAGILQRYFADFSFMFIAAAVLLAFIVNENLEETSPYAQLFKRTLSVLVALSVVYVALLCFVPEVGWFSDVYGWAYQDIVEAFEFWT